VPTCACGSKDLYLLGFELDQDLRTVLVTYRCARCSAVTKGRYDEQG
jgi:hypothetical protein